MKLRVFTRTTKRYCRICIVIFLVCLIGHLAILKQTQLLVFTDCQNCSSTVSGDIQSSQVTSNYRNATVNTTERDRDNVSKKEYNLNKLDTVIYSEDEVQIQLKAIHEEGERIIGLKHDECQQRLPTCLIIGNFKCGTQELLEFMFMHPRIRIYREPAYELHFFTGNYRKGYDWYRRQMPCSYSGQITVEKSPDYFQDPQSPLRIREMNPKMKLIALVRDPIERALSHFTFLNDTAKSYGYTYDRCALNSMGVNRNCFAIKHSIYDAGIRRYLQNFNKSQLLIINNDEFKNDPYEVLRDIETFLEIEHVIEKKHFVYIEDKGFYCVRSVVNETLVACYDHRRGRKNGRTGPINNISNDTMLKLKSFFKPLDQSFFQAIGKTYNWTTDI